jgi:glycosyltransferase involved in cell wall biosynthesis
MASLMAAFLASDLARKNSVRPVFTRQEGSAWVKLRMFFRGMAQFLWLSAIWRPHVCHIHFCSRVSFYRKSIFVIAAKLLGRKVVVQGHGGGFDPFYRSSNRLCKIFIRKMLAWPDRVLVGSQHSKEVLSRISGRSDVRVVNNFIADESIIGVGRCAESKSNLLFLGRIEKSKGIYELIDAAAIVKEKAPGVRFVLAGAGEIDQAKERCLEKQVTDMVEFTGWIEGDEKLALFQSAACFVLPSHRELQSIAVIEALAAGLPIVASDISGIREMVEDGVNGFLIRPGHARRLAEKIIQLLGNGALRRRMSRNNILKFKSQFHSRLVVSDVNQVYHSLLNPADTPHASQRRPSVRLIKLRARGIL